MTALQFSATGALEINASKTSAPTDFDFLTGDWKIQNRRLNSRLNNCTEWTEFDAIGTMHKILLGHGNSDTFKATFDGNPFEGMTLRLFNPINKLWSIYWADSNRLVLDPPVLGSFDGNLGLFYTQDIFNGLDVLVKFQWDKTKVDSPTWSQAFSLDQGKTWEWNWYMYFHRI